MADFKHVHLYEDPIKGRKLLRGLRNITLSGRPELTHSLIIYKLAYSVIKST